MDYFKEFYVLFILLMLFSPLLQKQWHTGGYFSHLIIYIAVKQGDTHTFSIHTHKSSFRHCLCLLMSHTDMTHKDWQTHAKAQKVEWHISGGAVNEVSPCCSNECADLTTLASHSSSTVHQVGHDRAHSQTHYSYLLQH